MNMNTRRNLMLAGVATIPMTLLAGCGLFGTTPTTGGVTGPPPLEQIQAWASVVVNELPTMEATLVSSGILKGAAIASFDTAVKAAQAELPNVMALTPSSANIASAVQALGNALTTASSFIPASAPYAPLVGIVVMLIEGLITATATPTPVAPTPPPAASVRAAASRAPVRR